METKPNNVRGAEGPHTFWNAGNHFPLLQRWDAAAARLLGERAHVAVVILQTADTLTPAI